jgi:predicted dithiol-disulfide oxidoreductase (DUF899 family)
MGESPYPHATIYRSRGTPFQGVPLSVTNSAQIPLVAALQEQMHDLRRRLAEARRAEPPRPVADYTFEAPGGARPRLSDLFGELDDLLVVHNMGRRCAYCTLWADGLNAFVPHLKTRAALVVSSPDTPEEQASFAAVRGWRFPMVSCRTNAFTKDMGFEPEPGKVWPGVTSFRREGDGRILNVASDVFGPGDDYCAIWHLFGLLRDGQAGWEPKAG